MFSRPKRQKQVLIDRQILVIHEAMANKVLAEPDRFDTLKDTLEHRYQNGALSYGSYLLWQGILEARTTPATFKSLLLAKDKRTASLRRKTIFTGILTEEERQEALAKYIASEES